MAVRNNLAVAQQRLGDLPAAEVELRRLVEARGRILGEDTIDAAVAAQNLGVLLVHTGRFAEAVDQLREALRIQELTFGPEHTSTISVLFDVGRALVLTGRIQEGLALMDEATARTARAPDGAHARCGLAVARAAASHEVDLAAVEQQLARAREWGLAQPVVLRRTGELIE
jgi:Flp pilus assembly protein TadD